MYRLVASQLPVQAGTFARRPSRARRAKEEGGLIHLQLNRPRAALELLGWTRYICRARRRYLPDTWLEVPSPSPTPGTGLLFRPSYSAHPFRSGSPLGVSLGPVAMILEFPYLPGQKVRGHVGGLTQMGSCIPPVRPPCGPDIVPDSSQRLANLILLN